MSRLTVELIASAREEYFAGYAESAIYHLLLAVVAAVDPDVNVADAAAAALAAERAVSEPAG